MFPISQPSITESEVDHVTRAVKSGWNKDSSGKPCTMHCQREYELTSCFENIDGN
jgi:dTDP-4-amino-4,6-dideoxygalactose transaminase